MKAVRRFDKGFVGDIERTPQGFLKIPGVCTRTGVFTYKDGSGKVRRELRHPDDVFNPESLDTLKNCVVTLQHPPEMVNPGNTKKYMKGYTTDKLEVSDDLIEIDLIISDIDLIEAIEDGGMREISAGYNATLIDEQGVYNGAEYDCRQTGIKYNHVAIVDKGRAGPEVRLRLDSNDAVMEDFFNTTIGDEDMDNEVMDMMKSMRDSFDSLKGDMEKMKADMYGKEDNEEMEDAANLGQSVPSNVPDTDMAPDGTSAVSKTNSGDTSGPAKAAGYSKDEDPDFSKPQGTSDGGTQMAPDEQLAKAIEERDMYKDKFDKAMAKLDEHSSETNNSKQKYDSADITRLVRIRKNLERKAELLVKPEIAQKFDSMTDRQIRVETIKARHPGFDSRDKSGVYLEARFDSVTEGVKAAKRLSVGTYNKKMAKFDSQSSVMDARHKMIEETRNQWKQPLSASKK